MDEKTRTKVLGGVLAVVLGFGLLRPDRALMEPIREAEADLDAASTAYDREDMKQMELLAARDRISRGRNTSLPPRASDAQRLYQSWITNLAEQCRFAQLQVTPGNKSNVRDQYLTVEVNVEAETDLDGLSRFLYLFEQADLMHRISSLEIESTGATGKPRMEIILTAEGLSVSGSPERSDIFARTTLPEKVDASATEISVSESADFPETTPFVAQLGREMVTVTAVNENRWTVERGQQGTTAVEHPADDIVQLFPVTFTRRDIAFSDYDNFLASSPFTKPSPPKVYKPRIASVTDKTIAPGDVVEMTAKAEDFNPDVGAIIFGLESETEGMVLDPATGEFKWETPGDLEPKLYETTFILTQKNNPELRVEKKVGITVELPNEAPTITVKDKAIVVLGRDFTMEVSAKDQDEGDSLTFSFEGDAPAGLSIDAATGTLKWSPEKTFSPGDYDVNVKVTDSGSPAKSATGKVTLTVQDDDAATTKFTGSVALDGQYVAWFRNLAKKARPELKVGDHIVAAEIDAELTEIAPRHVLMKDAEGVWRLKLGDSLRDRVMVKPAPSTETESEASPSQTPAAEAPAEETPASDAPATDSKPAETPSAEGESESKGDAETGDYDQDPPAEEKTESPDDAPAADSDDAS